MSVSRAERHGAAAAKQLREQLNCPICQELLLEPVSLPCCGNSYCADCLRKLCSSAQPKQAACPLCRAPLGERPLQPNRAFQALLELVYPKRSAARHRALAAEQERQRQRLARSQRYLKSWRACALADELGQLLQDRGRCWPINELQQALEARLNFPVPQAEVLFQLEHKGGALAAGWHRYGLVLFNADWALDLSIDEVPPEQLALLTSAAFLHERACAGDLQVLEYAEQQRAGPFALLGRARRSKAQWPLEFIDAIPEHCL